MTVEARDGGDTTGEDTFYKSATANIIITIEVKQLIFFNKISGNDKSNNNWRETIAENQST